jgi:S1-C subfamily serine protease
VKRRLQALAVAFVALAPAVRAQAPGVPVFDDDAILASITKQAGQLQHDGKLTAVATLAAQREARKRCRLELAAPLHDKLAPAAICAAAHRATWVIGTLYHCEDCPDWHFSGATGYAVAADGAIATCAHVVAPDPDSKDEYLAAAGPDGVVHPVVEVLAADLHTDCCIVRVDAKGLTPLALNVDTRPGDAVFCYGHPQHHFGFFSQGEIARFAVEPELPPFPPEGDGSGDERPEGAAPPQKRPAPEPTKVAAAPADASASLPPLVVMEITAEFAAGSSGSPVLDEYGNVVGHAAATEAVFWDDNDPSATNHQMTLRIVTVARDLLALIEPIPPPASLKSPDRKKQSDR